MSEKAENNNITDNQDIVLDVDVSENQTDNPNNDTNVTSVDHMPSNNTNNKNKSKKFWGKVDNFFKISERGSTFGRELFGGIINFLVISYILVVIPGLFNNVDGGTLWKALFLATIFTIVIATLSMAFFVNLPIILAPGIGLCSYVAQLVISGQYTFAQGMAISFMAGVAFLIITVTGLRRKMVDAIPNCVKVAMPVGVGLFILGIGMGSNSGILDLLNGNATSFAPIVALVSFFVMVVLYIKNIKGSIFIGIISGTVLNIIIELCMGHNPFAVLANNSWLPPFKELADKTLFKFDFAGLFSGNIVTSILSVLLIVFAVTLIDMFDTVGTLYATAKKGNLFDKNGQVININKAMMVDGCGAIYSACMGIPNATSYVESSAGIASGARTGFSNIVTSVLFLLAMFLSPLVMLIPTSATAPALILVGILMFDSVADFKLKDLTQSIPAVLTIIVMPLTSNITLGIALGIVSYTLINLFTGNYKKINVFTYIVSILFVLYFVMMNLM